MTDTVTLSLSELGSLITKAARGAGLSWGLAEEAGWAAEWLARRGLPAADWATVWLSAQMAGALNPVELGASLADEFAGTGASPDRDLPDDLAGPGYLLPFLHRIAQSGSAVAITSGLGHVALVPGSGKVVFGPAWQSRSEGWHLCSVKEFGAAPEFSGRPTVRTSVVECLEGLALSTTVPSSEASRKDAGSDSTDND